jgi:hypothetical protein
VPPWHEHDVDRTGTDGGQRLGQQREAALRAHGAAIERGHADVVRAATAATLDDATGAGEHLVRARDVERLDAIKGDDDDAPTIHDAQHGHDAPWRQRPTPHDSRHHAFVHELAGAAGR